MVKVGLEHLVNSWPAKLPGVILGIGAWGTVFGAGFLGFALVGNLSDGVKQNLQKIGYNDFADMATTFSYYLNPPVYGAVTGTVLSEVTRLEPYLAALWGLSAMVAGCVESVVRWRIEAAFTEEPKHYYPPSLIGAAVSPFLHPIVDYLRLRNAELKERLRR